MAVPEKYHQLQTFYKYYSGETRAPVLTLFVGGNHESTGYMTELPYGGWVAPDIYYMGFAGVLRFAGLRIAGLSGIYKFHDYNKGSTVSILVVFLVLLSVFSFYIVLKT